MQREFSGLRDAHSVLSAGLVWSWVILVASGDDDARLIVQATALERELETGGLAALRVEGKSVKISSNESLR